MFPRRRFLRTRLPSLGRKSGTNVRVPHTILLAAKRQACLMTAQVLVVLLAHERREHQRCPDRFQVQDLEAPVHLKAQATMRNPKIQPRLIRLPSQKLTVLPTSLELRNDISQSPNRTTTLRNLNRRILQTHRMRLEMLPIVCTLNPILNHMTY